MDQTSVAPPWIALLPFLLLLGSIALAPLFFANWWGKHYSKICSALAAGMAFYYCIGLRAPEHVVHTAEEYLSFIALVGSLFVVSGGIHIRVKGEATPMANTLYLAAGAVMANLLGTTGASMLLIRPWLRMNKYRVTGHHVVFFIFIVANVGCLTPWGSSAVPGLPEWCAVLVGGPEVLADLATGVAVLLVMFFLVDSRNYLRARNRCATS